MNSDGTNQINLTNNPADDRDPDWCCQTFQPIESIQPGSTTQAPPSPERLLSQWGLTLLTISLVVIIAIAVGRKTILRKE